MTPESDWSKPFAKLERKIEACELAVTALEVERASKLGDSLQAGEPARGHGSIAILARRLAKTRDEAALKEAEYRLEEILGANPSRSGPESAVQARIEIFRQVIQQRLASLAGGLLGPREGAEVWTAWAERLEQLLSTE